MEQNFELIHAAPSAYGLVDILHAADPAWSFSVATCAKWLLVKPWKFTLDSPNMPKVAKTLCRDVHSPTFDWLVSTHRQVGASLWPPKGDVFGERANQTTHPPEPAAPSDSAQSLSLTSPVV